MIQSVLKKVAKFEEANYNKILLIFLVLTLIVSSGMIYLKVQSDMNKSFPEDLPYFITKDRVTEKFGGQDSILILVSLDDDSNEKDIPLDIRDPRVIKFISTLSEKLENEEDIESVASLNNIFSQTGIPESTLEAKQILSSIPESDSFFNKEYSRTLIFLSANLGSDPDKLEEIDEMVREKALRSGIPEGIKIQITGTPSMMNLVFTLLISDAVKTIIIGAIIIFLMLIIMQRSFTKSTIVFLPLSFSIFWTLGTMGWLDIPISLATAGIGAMILGLGVEYGVFLLSRYQEERNKKLSRLDSMELALTNIGSSIIGSGLTTIVGFLALTISVMPLLQDLGLSLALGISYSLIITLLITPSFILFEESFVEWLERRNKK